ncbi:metalloprotease [Tenacibaculum sp. TC6]|uniref:metalloprotease n=1 Tax=Tenacibaculum sp. TC6 TaxID=3423223 RepID=UPI003D35AADF
MKNLKPFLLAFAAATLLTSCNESDTNPIQSSPEAKLHNKATHEGCSYIDQNWGSSAYISSTIVNQSETNFIKDQNNKIAGVFSISTVPLYFAKGSGTANAISYGAGYIIFGEQLYNMALSQAGRIACAMVQAHEVGHQLQYKYNLPTRRESTARASELEADGFAGYYIKKPNGYNATWTQAAPAYNFAGSIGDYNTTSPGHHGTPAQRRSAFRLGYLLGGYNLSVRDFDYNFFYYYDNYVLPGSLRKDLAKPKDIRSDIHEFILSKVDELRKISTGEISKEEFEKL